MSKGVKYYTDEARHRAYAAARWTGGTAIKQSFTALTQAGSTRIALTAGHALEIEGLTWWQAASQGVGTYGLGLAGIALGAGIKFFLNHKEMKHQNHQLMNYYRHELAAKYGIPTSKVDDETLYQYARENPSFTEELNRNRAERNMKTAAWTLGAIVSTIVAVSAILTFGGATLPLFAAIGISIAAGLPTQWVAEHIFHKAGEKIFGLDEATTMEQISALERDQSRGNTVSQERIMAAYVSASPDLQEMIQRDYGRRYEKLSLVNQHDAILRYGDSFGLTDVTNAINEHRMSAKELAFRVHGDTSNAYPEPTLYDQMREQVHAMKHQLAQKRQHAAEKWDLFAQQVKSKKDDVAHKLADTKELWVSKLGLAPKAEVQEQGWADRVTANSNVPATGLGS